MLLEALGDPDGAGRLLAAVAARHLDTATTTVPTIESNHQGDPAPASSDHHHHHHHHHHATTLQALPCFNDLIAVLIECFSLIAIGYLSGRFRVISPDAKDLSAYLTTFALPMIIFLNVVQMEIQTINLSFLVCMLVSKLLIFLLVALVTLAISYPSNFSYAGALSILSTQSNDFALGYPLFKSLYGESKPEMLNYLNLMGPIQLLVINPLGIIMLEFGKSQLKRRTRHRRAAGNSSRRPGRCHHCRAGVVATVLDKHGARRSPDDELGQSSRPQRPDGGVPARKNCKSLVLVMPGREVSPCSLDSDSSSISSGKQQVTGDESKALSPNLLGELAEELDQQTVGTAREPVATGPCNWLTSLTDWVRNNQPSDAACLPRPALPASQCTCWTDKDEPAVDLNFLWALMKNPLIIMSLAALAVNLLHGPELPKFVTKVSTTIAASFAAPALLVVGLSMYGKFKLILRNPNDLLLSSVLVMTKVMVLPNIMRTVMQVSLPYYVEPSEIPYLVDFSYLYGLLPTAPGACIIAKQYEVLTNVVSICMVLSTFISAPLMLGTSVVISKAAQITPETIGQIMGRVMRVSSSLTVTLTLLTLYLLWKANKNSVRAYGETLMNSIVFRSRHMFTLLLTYTQLLVGIGGFIWLLVEPSQSGHSHAAFQKVHLSSGDHLANEGVWRTADPIVADEDDDSGELLMAPYERLQILSRAHPPARPLAEAGSQSLSSVACTLFFIQASAGLLLAKFLILCLVVTNFARHSHGHQMAGQVSSLMTRILPLLSLGVVMCLVFESKHLSCQPSEASLPRWPFSLYLRLVFNTLLLLMALPMFVCTLRLKNKNAKLRADELLDANSDVSPGIAAGAPANKLTKRHFEASSVSISSETSSEMTTSTNLEMNQAHTNASPARNTQATFASANQQAADAANLLIIDYERFYQQKHDSSPHSNDKTLPGATRSLCDMNNNSTQHGGQDELLNQATLPGSASVETNFRVDDSLKMSRPNRRRSTSQTQRKTVIIQFDRMSILAVFMLFQTMLGVTSIMQILFQDGFTSGSTFIMVELTSTAVDFGQGLMTFLVVGTQAFATRSAPFGSAQPVDN